MPRCVALLPAAGIGARMAAGRPKQYLPLAGRPMLWHAIRALSGCRRISATYVVLSPSDHDWDSHDWSELGGLRVLRCGGATRAESVLNGLAAMAGEVTADDWVLVHDAARPCLRRPLVERLLDGVLADPVGGLLAMPVADTMKRGGPDGRIVETVPRSGLWAAQTPQMFRHGLLRRALGQAGPAVTDEASAVEHLGLRPRLVESDLSNLKVTFPGDAALAEWLLSRNP